MTVHDEIDNDFEYDIVEEKNIKQSICTSTYSFFKNVWNNVKNCFWKSVSGDTLHVISVISNPANYSRRVELMKQFIERMETSNGMNLNNNKNQTKDYKLYIVELVYGTQEFRVTESTNPHHLQLRTEHPLWHKENMINLAIKNLLPTNWKYVAWIDADIEFDSPHWYSDTVQKLKTDNDVVQMFSVALDLNENNITQNYWQSYGYKFVEGNPNDNIRGTNYWHPGYAWAMTREAYDHIGKLLDFDIIGSADYRMAKILTGSVSIFAEASNGYKQMSKLWANKVKGLRLGYVPGVIRHYYHGDKKNRRYIERNDIVKNYNYNPYIHITYDENGVIVPTDECPKEMLEKIVEYFNQRNEDDIYQKNDIVC
jgi:hypothetical protein